MTSEFNPEFDSNPSTGVISRLYDNRYDATIYPITVASAVYVDGYQDNLESVVGNLVSSETVITDVDDLLAVEEPGYLADASALSELLSGLNEVSFGRTEYVHESGYIEKDVIIPFSGVVDTSWIAPGSQAVIPLNRGRMYELYTYERRIDTKAFRGMHAYLISSPVRSGDKPELVPMAISASSGVTVTPNIETDDDGNITPVLNIVPSSTAYKVKFILKQVYGHDFEFLTDENPTEGMK